VLHTIVAPPPLTLVAYDAPLAECIGFIARNEAYGSGRVPPYTVMIKHALLKARRWAVWLGVRRLVRLQHAATTARSHKIERALLRCAIKPVAPRATLYSHDRACIA